MSDRYYEFGLSWRELLAASSGVGAAAITGCTAASRPADTVGTRTSEEATETTTTSEESDLPTTSPPEVVQVDER